MNDDKTENEISLRKSILDTAARLILEKGYHGVGMREIALQSGTSKALLYYYFKNKAELFYAIIKDNVQQVGELAFKARENRRDVRGQIREVFSAIASWPVEQRAMIYIAKQEARHLPDEIRQRFLRQYHDQFIGRVQEIFQDGILRGELREMDTSLAVQMLLGILSPVLASEWAKNNEPFSSLESILDVLFNGIMV